MGQKRELGLGKASKLKKRKSEQTKEPSTENELQQSNELTIELNEEIDADDELAQLKALWKTYATSEEKNELVLNGIVHECDRLLRNSDSSEESRQKLPDFFHSIYALALSALAAFQENPKKAKSFFTASLERIELGISTFPDSVNLLVTKSRILLSQLLLQYIGSLDEASVISSENPDISKLLDEALQVYEEGERKADSQSLFEAFNEENFETLQMFDDLLEHIDNFGKKKNEEDSSDEEASDDEEEGEEIEVEEDENVLSKEHPLYEIRTTDKYNQWWRDHTIKFLNNVRTQIDKDEHHLSPLSRQISKLLGQSFLQEAEVPSNVFTSLTYDENLQGTEELAGLTKEQAQEYAKDLLKKGLEYLEAAEHKDEPESWVMIAEAKISLANLYELDSEDQEQLYAEAEKILTRANRVTHGKFQSILDNLLES
ncbi:uncharacterized protein PRCAT00002141001 [Priceomyces carsonii]|uniref:uncharacterized protein n=1 Tax=Priceomyces carsonii TaxID=28549 RepID=UPI002ED80ECA|nr:unnamed protein product [Priceomyces carsonii]